jgi:histone deacetylase 1/2
VKKTTTINLYLLKIKKIVDTLAAIGSPMDTEAHIDAIFDGLPEEYDGFVTSVLSRSEQYSVSQIESLLMAQEERLERHKRNDSQVMQANLTQNFFQQKKYGFSQGQGRGWNNNQSKGNSRGRNRGRSTSNQGGRSRIICQVCGKPGHIAFHCWHMFDQQIGEPNLNQESIYIVELEHMYASHGSSTTTPCL